MFFSARRRPRLRRAGLFRPPDAAAEVDEVHISVAFTYDKMFADHLAEQ